MTAPKIFLFEMICGGGCFEFQAFGEPRGSLLSEGQQILCAVAEQWLGDTDAELVIPIDQRIFSSFDSEWRQNGGGIFESWQDLIGSDRIHYIPVDSKELLDQLFIDLSKECDYGLLIAPEIENALHEYCLRCEELGLALLSPNSKVIELCSDKWVTFQHLKAAGIAIPETRLFTSETMCSSMRDFAGKQAMIKPRHGAGSLGVRKVVDFENETLDTAEGMLVQPFIQGVSASIGVMRSLLGDCVYFPAVQQNFVSDSWTYKDCEPIESAEQSAIVVDLAKEVVDSLPDFVGYLGIDIVLTDKSNSQRSPQGYVIEINPRFTTSFCQTRKWIGQGIFGELLRH